MQPTFRQQNPSRLRNVLVYALVILVFIILTGIIDGGTGVVPQALWNGPDWMPWWRPPLRMVANAVPGLMVAAVMLSLTRRLALAAILGLAAEAVIYFVSAVKFANLGTPLMPADFLMAGQLVGGGAELLVSYLPASPWPYVIAAVFIATILLLARYEPAAIRRRWSRRAPAALLLVAALVTLFVGWQAWRVVYHPGRLDMRPWSPQATRQKTGLISSLQLFHLKYASEHHEPDTDVAQAFMAKKSDAVQRKQQENAAAGDMQGRPDIIIILSESLFDPTTLNGYAGDTDLLPNLHRLARHGISGRMHSPTFGGGTIRTGFEILTGMSLRYFDDIQSPWLQIHRDTIPGIVRLLKAHGYTTQAVHGNDASFWNRVSAFKALGFDRFHAIDDFAKAHRHKDGKYISDKAFTNEMLARLDTKGPPQFMYGISIEAHGPYRKPYGIDTDKRDAIPVPDTITGDARTHLQNYIYHIRHADKQLGRLIDTLKERDRRTIVLFFGDHLPALVPAFQQAGFDNGKDFLAQPTPYLIYDTGRPNATPQKHEAAAWTLPGMVLQQAGIDDDPWFALTDLVGPQLADLTRSPDAPPVKPDAGQKQLEKGFRNVTRLRLEGKFKPLWHQTAPSDGTADTASDTSAPTPASSSAARAAHAGSAPAHTRSG